MSTLLQSIRTVERVMTARSLIPLLIGVIALAAHLALEVERSRVAAVGLKVEDDVIPAAAHFVSRLHTEAAARFTSPAGSTTSALGVEQVVDSTAGVTGPTDAALGDLDSALTDVRSASEPLADSDTNLGPCVSPDCGAAAIRAQLTTFRNAASSAAQVTAALNAIQRILPRTLMAAYVDSVAVQESGRLLHRLGAAYVESLVASYLEVTTSLALFHRTQSLGSTSAVDAHRHHAIDGFIAARASLRYLLAFKDLPFGLADPLTYADIVAEAETALTEAELVVPLTTVSYLNQTSFTLSLTALRSLQALTGRALGVANRDPDTTNRTERNGLWVAVGVLAAVALSLILTAVIVGVHVSQSTNEMALLTEFTDAETMKDVAAAYQPVLSGLRVDSLAKKEQRDVELARIYTEAARLVSEIRPFLPQTLFGALNDDSLGMSLASANNATSAASPADGGKAAAAPATGGASPVKGAVAAGPSSGAVGGASVNPTLAAAEAASMHTVIGGIFRRKTRLSPWHPWEYSVRLDSTVCSATCTILTVVPLKGNKEVLRDPDDLLSWYNSLLATAVTLVNQAGGAIHAVENNGIIVGVWNLTQKTDNAAAVALKVARAIRASCSDDEIDVNIVTGPCMVANAKTGRRRNVVVVGSALEFAERVLLLNRLHNSSIVIDFDSYRDLSLDEQARCRPIALLHTSPTSRVVLYSADNADASFTMQQRKEYSAAFSLYQNGMYEDSLSHFTQYLRQYGSDGPAEWIVAHLLSHKLRPIDTMASHAQVNATDRGEAMTTLEELAVWGGG